MPLDRIKRSKVRLGIVSTLVSKRTQPPGRLIFRKIKHRFDTWITISRAQSVVMKAFYHPFHPDRKMHATAQKYQLMDRFERVQLGFYFSEFSRASKLLIFLDAPLVDKKGNKKERERETSRMLFFLSFFLFSPLLFLFFVRGYYLTLFPASIRVYRWKHHRGRCKTSFLLRVSRKFVQIVYLSGVKRCAIHRFYSELDTLSMR